MAETADILPLMRSKLADSLLRLMTWDAYNLADYISPFSIIFLAFAFSMSAFLATFMLSFSNCFAFMRISKDAS